MEDKTELEKKNYFLPFSMIFSVLILGGAIIYATVYDGKPSTRQAESDLTELQAKVLPEDGITLPVRWNDLGKQMVETGVIDKDQFEALYAGRGGLNEEEKQLLYGASSGNLKMTPQNANYLLNLFWALGLANKNPILEQGPMMDPNYGGAEVFASTGGWTLARGNVMDHYSRYSLINLTPEQKDLVLRVSQNIYRPCCDNPVYFPDCNHGMAMLGLLELMASQDVSEAEMYRVALQVNAYWFPDTYLTIAKYLEIKGVDWEDADPKGILGAEFSSASGFSRVLAEVEPAQIQGGGSCGV